MTNQTRKILSIPYNFFGEPEGFVDAAGDDRSYTVWKLIEFPTKERLCTPELEPVWHDLRYESPYKEWQDYENFLWHLYRQNVIWLDTRKNIVEECRKISQKNDRMFVIGGDHLLSYPLLQNQDLDQVIVIDRGDDGFIRNYDISYLQCGNWGNFLRRDRPDLDYLFISYDTDEASLQKINDKKISETNIEILKPVHNVYEPAYNVKFPSLLDALDSNLGHGKTALSICADSSGPFWSYYFTTSFITPNQISKLIDFLEKRTDLRYIDIMEANLFEDEAVRATKSILKNLQI